MKCERVDNSIIFNENALDVLDFLIKNEKQVDMIVTDPAKKRLSEEERKISNDKQ